MASRYVVCKDKEEAQRMAEAGLLYLVPLLNPAEDYVQAALFEEGDVAHALQYYGTSAWPPKEFAYLVEED